MSAASDNPSSRKQSAERRWIPAAYLDEVTPPGRAKPDDWIGDPHPNIWHDLWYLASRQEGQGPDIVLKPGQVFEFAWVEDLGEVAVELRADGTHVVRGLVPPGVTHFWFDGDTDTLADALDEFVASWRGMNIGPAEGETVLVRMNRWSEDAEPFQFDVTERGPRFIRPGPARDPAKPRGAP